jgi:Raf kinase inhibitor-like YbhB/YbcL family protein
LEFETAVRRGEPPGVPVKYWIVILVAALIPVGFCRAAQTKKNTGGPMELSSPAFKQNAPIPGKYTCDGTNVNPPLEIKNVPAGAKSLALIVDDPDAPGGVWLHWLVYDIPVTTARIGENSIPGFQGTNDFHKKNYGGPCPPSGTHRYFFRLFALGTALNLREGTGRKDVEKAMEGHVLEKTELMGTYKRR